VTRAKLDDPKANSWLPFTGDLDLRAAISDFTAERPATATTPSARSSSPRRDGRAPERPPLHRRSGDEVIVTDPTYAGIVNRIRSPAAAALRPVPRRGGRLALRPRPARRPRRPETTGFLLMSPSMPSGGYLDEDDWLAVCDLCRERDLFLIYDAAMERLLFDGRRSSTRCAWTGWRSAPSSSARSRRSTG
jgi:bifunctional pyridoxal-dependent enzyme with beta-cystathionase and maltose regulon repressor activities